MKAKESSGKGPNVPSALAPDAPQRRSHAIMSEVIGVESGDRMRVIDAVERGFETSAVVRLAATLQIAEGDVLEAVDISRSTFSWRKKQQERLTTSESDRLYRVIRLFGRVVEVLGSESDANSGCARQRVRWAARAHSSWLGPTPARRRSRTCSAGSNTTSPRSDRLVHHP